MTLDQGTIDAVRTAYADCFGCGMDNDVGLKLDGFTVDQGVVEVLFNPTDPFCGFEGMLHGGIVATALDEVSAWSAMLTEGVFVFTARLNISYRNKARVGASLLLRARVTERRGRRLAIDASMLDDDRVLAESDGMFVVAGNVREVPATQDRS